MFYTRRICVFTEVVFWAFMVMSVFIDTTHARALLTAVADHLICDYSWVDNRSVYMLISELRCCYQAVKNFKRHRVE